VCLVSSPLSRRSERALGACGWALVRVPAVANPGRGAAAAFGAARFPSKLRHVYAKLAVFNLTAYKRVVYLDADTLVVPPGADALFRCAGALCAALRHSERFNSGVMVLEPHAATARNMSALLRTLPSYTGCNCGCAAALLACLLATRAHAACVRAQRRPGLSERLLRGAAWRAAVRAGESTRGRRTRRVRALRRARALATAHGLQRGRGPLCAQQARASMRGSSCVARACANVLTRVRRSAALRAQQQHVAAAAQLAARAALHARPA
jgi:hypothetical protein